MTFSSPSESQIRDTSTKCLALSMLIVLLTSLSGCTKTKLFVANYLANNGLNEAHYDIRYGEHERQKLDIYLPKMSNAEEITSTTNSALPIVVFVPGGCWGACSTFPKEDYKFVAEGFVSIGHTVVILNYRLYPDYLFPDQMEDMEKAIQWLTSEGRRFGIPDSPIYLMGHSAGAHLAAMVSYNEGYLNPNSRKRLGGFIGLAGPYDFLPFTEDYQPTLFGPEERYPESQPILFIDGNEPPSLLLYGREDSRVKPRNIINLSKTIENRGGQVKAICYTDIDHGAILGSLSSVFRDKRGVYKDITNYLDGQIDFTHSNDLELCGGVSETN